MSLRTTETRTAPPAGPRAWLAIAIVVVAVITVASLLPAASAAEEPPELISPVKGEIRVRVKRGSADAYHQITMYIDRAENGRGWDEMHDLGRLVGRNSVIDTHVEVQPDDILDIELYVRFQAFSRRIRYTTARRASGGETEPRVIASQNGFRCGSLGGGEQPLDVSDLTRTADHLISLTCWEDWTDFDYNDFALCVDYTPGTVPTVTPTALASPSPTPTSTSTATPTVTPTVTVMATATPSPTVTPPPTVTAAATPVPGPVYLPVALRQRCKPELRRADVVLVLDMSTSMYRETREGRTKLEAATDAAAQFADLLRLVPDDAGRTDQLAIVGFNAAAWTEVSLTTDRTMIGEGLKRLLEGVGEGTRLDLAFDEGQRALDGPGRDPANQPVIVLLTDGLPNRVPTPAPSGPQEQTVLEAAARAKAKGTRVFTVGLGQPDDVLRPLLEAAASTPDDYFFAPDGEDLAAIYRQVAVRIDSCP